MGWLFVGPFGIVFLALLIAPLGFALYLSLFQKALIGGTSSFSSTTTEGVHRPELPRGVVRHPLLAGLIPLQIVISLAIALILDS